MCTAAGCSASSACPSVQGVLFVERQLVGPRAMVLGAGAEDGEDGGRRREARDAVGAAEHVLLDRSPHNRVKQRAHRAGDAHRKSRRRRR